MRTKTKQQLCKVDDIAPGKMKQFTVKKRPIVVVRKENEFYALSGVCPHQGAMLAKGSIRGTNLPSEVGEFCYGKKGQIIRCPWHNHEFDAETGTSMHDPENSSVKSYKVLVEGDNVFIEI